MKDIKGYEGLYAVTSCGRVWSYKSKMFLNPWKSRKGYYQVELHKNKKRICVYVHRLVAEAYIPNLENLTTVDHINGVKTENHVNNLQWMTVSANKHKGSGKDYKILCVETGEMFGTIRECAKKLNVNCNSIGELINGRRGRKSAGGLHFIKI